MKKLLSTIKRVSSHSYACSGFQSSKERMDVLEGSMGPAGLRESAGTEA